MTQHGHGVHPRRPPGGQPARQERHEEEQGGHGPDRGGVCRAHLVEQPLEQSANQ